MNGTTLRIPTHLPAVLALGTVSQIGQALFLRELLMVFHGSELSIGLILAAWLIWVGVGSRLGGLLSRQIKQPLRLLTLTASGLALFIPLTILVMRGLRDLFNVLPGTYLSLQDMALTCFLVMAPTCLLLGIQFVLLSRVWREKDHKKDTSGASKTYVGEAAGNMLGGLVFTFLMVRNLNTIQSALSIAAIMPVAILPLIWKPGNSTKYLRWMLLGMVTIVLALLPFAHSLDQWSHKRQWQAFSPQHQLVETHQSKHGTIAILEREGQYHFYQSGHLVFSTAGPEIAQPGMENQDAVSFAHFSMAMHQHPYHILLIGGGLRGVLSEISKHPVEKVDYIELDEVLTKAARSYIPAVTLKTLDDPRIDLIHTDGRLFVKTKHEKYDLIIVDVPDPATAVLNRYYTQEFFREAKALLNPDGVLILGSMTTPDLRGLAVANRNATIYHTLKSVFSQVAVAGEQFLFYIATNAPGQISIDPLTLQERYESRNIHTEGFTPHQYQTILYEPHLRRASWVLRHHGRTESAHLEGPEQVPIMLPDIVEQERATEELPPVNQHYFINTDMRPIGYYYTVMFLEALTRAGPVETLESLLSIQPWWIIALLGFPLLITFGLRARLRTRHEIIKKHTARRFSILYSVFSTGFSTMAMQIALIFSFQSIYGFVYEIIGIIMALFMFGLALGAFFANRYIKDKANINTLTIVQLLIAVFAGVMALGLPGAVRLQSLAMIFVLFSSLTFIAGLINGVGFPLSAACSMRLNKHAEKSAGVVYSMELFGACFGAALASVIIAPIYGIVACCLIAGFANITAFGMLMISRRS